MIGAIVKGDFAGFVIALAWLECIITIGRHPWFKHWNIYVLMVFTVFWEFGKILFYYSFFIITAGLGFYVHLHSRYTVSTVQIPRLLVNFDNKISEMRILFRSGSYYRIWFPYGKFL